MDRVVLPDLTRIPGESCRLPRRIALAAGSVRSPVQNDSLVCGSVVQAPGGRTFVSVKRLLNTDGGGARKDELAFRLTLAAKGVVGGILGEHAAEVCFGAQRFRAATKTRPA